MAILALSLPWLATASPPAAAAPPAVTLTEVTTGLTMPVAITHPGDTSGRLFFTEQEGVIKVRTPAGVVTTYLDIKDLVKCCEGNEPGLLSVAFHPAFETNGFFFVFYTAESGDDLIARYNASPPNSNTPTITGGGTVLSTGHPADPFHHGGQLMFGPDGSLYISVGDGGGAGDPENDAQALTNLLGKILRINPTLVATPGYTIPADNPFHDGAGTNRDEIWHLGLRNPWRFSFDRQSGDMFVGDVGQASREEISFQANGQKGLNFGWRRKEGTRCFNPTDNCDPGGLTDPILEYINPSTGTAAVTGGFRYRGPNQRLTGLYFYADFSSGQLWAGTESGGSWTETLLLDTALNFSSFGEDEDGNLYVADYSGSIYRIDSVCAPSDFFAFNTGFTGGVYVAAGDVDGDGCGDVIAGAGAGASPHLRVLRSDGSVLAQTFPFDLAFSGGVRVAAADVNGDGDAEVVAAAGPGGGPHVKIFDYSLSGLVEINSFFPFAPSFSGGVFPAGGNFVPAAGDELAFGAGEGGGPHVKIMSGTGGTFAESFPFDINFHGGVRVGASGMHTGDPEDELLTGAGPGGGPHVMVWDVLAPAFVERLSFFPYDEGFGGGVFVGGGQLNATQAEEVITGAGEGGGPHVRMFSSTLVLLQEFFAYDVGFTGGVRVAGSAVDVAGDGEIVTGAGPSGGPHVKIVE